MSDHQTWLDVAGNLITVGAPILLQVLANRGQARFSCTVVDIRPGEVDVEINGHTETYVRADVRAEVAA